MLTSPAPGEHITSTTPTLMWTHSPGATGYRVQVDIANTFTGTLPVNVLEGATTYSYMVPALAGATTYHWRVIAEGFYGQTIAGPRTFITP